MTAPEKLLFLPGATGNVLFWQKLAVQLTHPAERVFAGYPGFGSTPADPKVNGFDALASSIIHTIDAPTAIIAQSMGGVIAIRTALARPDKITHLVLTATSGGINTQRFGAEDWRASYAREYPQLPDWFTTHSSDLSIELRNVTIPTLLLWGDADPISPIAIGQHLLELLPDAKLHIVRGGAHDLAMTHASAIAPVIDRFLLG